MENKEQLLEMNNTEMIQNIYNCIMQGKEFFRWSDWDYLFTPSEILNAFKKDGQVHTMHMTNTTIH